MKHAWDMRNAYKILIKKYKEIEYLLELVDMIIILK